MARKKEEQTAVLPEPSFEEAFPEDDKATPPNGLYYSPVEEGKINLTYMEAKANLSIPIDPAMISQKDSRSKGKVVGKIDYVNVTDLKDLLDERVAVWTAHVKSNVVAGEQLAVVVSLSIDCIDGVYTQDGTGMEWLNHNGFGDTFSNAYAQAFRRACEGHGLGRALWRKVDESEVEFDVHDDNYPEPSRHVSRDEPFTKVYGANNQQAPNRDYNREPPQPQYSGNGGGGSDSPAASAKQKTYIDNLCTEKNLNPELISLELFKTNFDMISRTQASEMIKYITKG